MIPVLDHTGSSHPTPGSGVSGPFAVTLWRIGRWLAGLMFFAVPASGQAQLVIRVGVPDAEYSSASPYSLLPNTPGQSVSVYVKNTGGSAVQVGGVQLKVQVGDTGPASEGGVGTIDGPNITGLDVITGTAFAANNNGNHYVVYPDPGVSKQFALCDTSTSSGTVTLAPGSTTLFATLTLDTTGFSAPDYWPCYLGGTVDGPSYYLDSTYAGSIPLTIYDGSMTVPEPRAEILIGTLLLAGGLGWRRLRARQRSVSGISL